MRAVVIGTRGSALSLRQTQLVQARLEQRHPGRRFTLSVIKAQADREPDAPLAAISGGGVFVKELEAALLGGQIDLAVHSLKDVPTMVAEGLRLAAITQREDARDALIGRDGAGLRDLPRQARIGTSSPRRRSQLLAARADLRMMEIRGNVDTRLRKLGEGACDAIVLAACGLIRLGLEACISEYLDLDVMLPEPGQGALAIEARADDEPMREIAAVLDDAPTRSCVEAERAFLAALGGGCRVPIGAYGEPAPQRQIRLRGAVTAVDGSKRVVEALAGPADAPITLGQRLAERVIANGARSLLEIERRPEV